MIGAQPFWLIIQGVGMGGSDAGVPAPDAEGIELEGVGPLHLIASGRLHLAASGTIHLNVRKEDEV